MVGGYKVIDLGGASISGAGTTVSGIYEAIESSVGKPILLRNFVVSGSEVSATYVFISTVGDVFRLVYRIASGSFSVLDVSSSDVVTFRALATNNPAGDPPVSDEDGPSASM